MTGTDGDRRIVGVPGRWPVLANVARHHIARFRATVEVVDRIGEGDPGAIVAAARDCAERSPGPAEPPDHMAQRTVTPGYLPTRIVADHAGYFVIYADRQRYVLRLEHYTNDGILDAIIEGATPAHCTALVNIAAPRVRVLPAELV